MHTQIQQIATFVEHTMSSVKSPDLKIGHDLKHVLRVHHHALLIAEQENYPHLAQAEATALLHDVGLAYVTDRKHHAEAGAEIATQFLRKQAWFEEPKIAEISKAIRDHSAIQADWSPLGFILRDADILDMLGAVGLMRAFTSKYDKPEYDPNNIRGETWSLTADDFTARYRAGLGIGPTIIDQINFQISVYDELHTTTARQIAKPRVDFMCAFVEQLAREISG